MINLKAVTIAPSLSLLSILTIDLNNYSYNGAAVIFYAERYNKQLREMAVTWISKLSLQDVSFDVNDQSFSEMYSALHNVWAKEQIFSVFTDELNYVC